MKIIDKELNIFGNLCRIRFVPKTFHFDLGNVGKALFSGNIKEAEDKLNKMRTNYCSDGIDDKDMFYLRNQINSIKREVNWE